MPTPSNLSKIANFQVRTGADMVNLVDEVSLAISDETGFPGESHGGKGGPTDPLTAIKNAVQGSGDPAKIAPYFGKLRDYATREGAPQTSSAVVSAAKWFWCNVEDPAACQAASRSTIVVAAVTGGAPDYARKTMLTKKTKQTLLYVGVPVLLTGIGLYFILRD